MFNNRFLLSWLVGGLSLFGQEPPAGKYLICHPSPWSLIEFNKNELVLTPIQNEFGKGTLEIKPGVKIHHKGASTSLKNAKAFSVLSHIKVKNGQLFFDEVPIDFGVLKVYKIREAFRWGAWVVCDGYTSASEDMAKHPEKYEGFQPSELIYFKPIERFGKTKPLGGGLPFALEIVGD